MGIRDLNGHGIFETVRRHAELNWVSRSWPLRVALIHALTGQNTHGTKGLCILTGLKQPLARPRSKQSFSSSISTDPLMRDGHEPQ